jgi:thiol-disulfide isomerase/thioredoxin
MAETKTMMLGAVIVGLLVLAMFYGLGGTFGRGLFEGFQGGSKAPDVNTFTMYYADWCPHCQVAKPEFTDLTKKGATELAGGKRCYFRMVNPDTSPELIKGKKIAGFPTFLLETTEGETVEYKGDRSTDGYMKFLNEKLGGGI